MVVRCLYGAKEQNTGWGRRLFSACTVLKEQNLAWGQCLYGGCSVLIILKEEQQTHHSNQSNMVLTALFGANAPVEGQ